MSLKDQLLKSGLATKKQARKVAQEAQKERKANKGKKAAADPAAKAAFDERLEAQRERDRQLNRERLEKQAAKEALARARQVIETNSRNDPKADVPYHFVVGGRFVHRIFVTASQTLALESGRMGIATTVPGEKDYHLLEWDTCQKVREILPDLLVCLHPAVSTDTPPAPPPETAP